MSAATFNTLRPEDMTFHSRSLGASVRPTEYHPQWNSDIQHLARDVQSFIGGPAFQQLLREKLEDEGFHDATQFHDFFDDKRITVHLTAGSIDVEVEGLEDRTSALALQLLDHGGLNLDEHIEAIHKQVEMREHAAYTDRPDPMYTHLMQRDDMRFRRPFLIPLMKEIDRIFGPADRFDVGFGPQRVPEARSQAAQETLHLHQVTSIAARDEDLHSDYGTGESFTESSGSSHRDSPAPLFSQEDSSALLRTIADMRKELETERLGRQTAESKLEEALDTLHKQQEVIASLEEDLLAARSAVKEAQSERDQVLKEARNLKLTLSDTKSRLLFAEGRAEHAEADAAFLAAQAKGLAANFDESRALLDTTRQSLKEVRAEAKSLEEHLAVARSEAMHAEADATLLRQNAAELTDNFHTSQALLADAKGNLAAVRAEKGALEDEVKALKAAAEKSARTIDKKDKALKKLDRRSKDLEAQIERLDHKSERLTFELGDTRRAGKKAFEHNQAQLFKLEGDLESAISERNQAKAELKEVKSAYSIAASELEDLKAANATQAQSLEAQKTALLASSSALQEAKSSLAAALKEKAGVEGEVAALKQKLIASQVTTKALTTAIQEEFAAKAEAEEALAEVNGTIAELEEQNELVIQELHLEKLKVIQLEAQKAAVEQLYEEAKEHAQGIEGKLVSLTQALEVAKGEKAEALSKAEEADAIIQGLQSSLQTEKTNYEEVLDALKKLLAEARQEAKAALENYQESEALANAKGQEVLLLQRELAELQQELSTKRDEVALVHQTASSAVEEHISQSADLEDRILTLEDDLELAQTALKEEKAKATSLKGQLDGALATIETLNLENTDLVGDLKKARKTLSKMREIHEAEFKELEASYAEELAEASSKVQEQNRLLQARDEEIQTLQDELESLKATPSQVDETALIKQQAEIRKLQTALQQSEEERSQIEEAHRAAALEHEELKTHSLALFNEYIAQKEAFGAKGVSLAEMAEKVAVAEKKALESSEKLTQALADKKDFIEEVKGRMRELEEERRDAQINYEEAFARSEEVQRALKGLDEKHKETLAELKRAQAELEEIQRREPQVIISPEQTQMIAKLRQELQTAEASKEALLEQITALEKDKVTAESILSKSASTIEEQMQAFAAQQREHEEQIEALERKLLEAQAAIKQGALENEQALSALTEQFDSDMRALYRRLESAKQQSASLEVEKEKLEELLERAHTTGINITEELQEAREAREQQDVMHKKHLAVSQASENQAKLEAKIFAIEIAKLKVSLSQSNLQINVKEADLREMEVNYKIAQRQIDSLRQHTETLSEIIQSHIRKPTESLRNAASAQAI